MPTARRGYWTSAKGVVYFNSAPIKGCDSASFAQLNDTWVRDATSIYCYGSKVGKADAASFHVLNDLYAKDKNHAFYPGGVIKEADAESFAALDDGVFVREFHNAFGDHVQTRTVRSGFAADATKVFHYVLTIGKPCVLKNADRATFELLGGSYARDKNRVYFEKSPVKGADRDAFRFIPPLWGKDANSVYYAGGKVDGASPSTFYFLSSYDFLTSDGTRFFDRCKEIPREMAFPHGSAIAGYPVGSAKSTAQIADYLRRGATPHDRLALNRACHEGNVDVVRMVLGAGCDPKITDAGHDSCLTELRGNDSVLIAQMLVSAGANVNHMQTYSPAVHGKPLNAAALHHPLQHALHSRQFRLAEFLVSAGADVNAATGEGMRLIEYFNKHGNAEAVAFLKQSGAT